MNYKLYWTPTRCDRVSRAWAKEITGVQPETVIQFVCAHTGMEHVTSNRQLQNGTLMFYDREFNEYSAIYLPTGYVRRAASAWSGQHEINGRPYAWYQLNKQKRVDVGGWKRVERIVHPNDVQTLAQRLVQAYKSRHKRCVMTDRGPLTHKDIERINSYDTDFNVEAL